MTNLILTLLNKKYAKRYLNRKKNGKATGPDEISAEILKYSYDVISPLLVSLFNKLFNNAEYPENCSLGNVIPIFKGGVSNNPKHYRKIPLILLQRHILKFY